MSFKALSADQRGSFLPAGTSVPGLAVANQDLTISASGGLSVQLVDMYTFNFGYIGSRATGNGAGCFAVTGPDWKGETPAGDLLRRSVTRD